MRSFKRQEMRAAGLMLPLPASYASCSLPPCSLRAVVVGQTLEKSLVLKNNSDYAVAFKVKTTAPKRYCVRPNSSVIKAHESMQVRIVMQVALLAAGVHAPAGVRTLMRLTRPLCATIAQRRACACARGAGDVVRSFRAPHSPFRFRVRPLLPSVSHSVWLAQPLKELPPPGQPFKDKFLVQACQTSAATDDAKAIFEGTDKDAIIDQKLLCTFNIPGAGNIAHEPNDSAVNATGMRACQRIATCLWFRGGQKKLKPKPETSGPVNALPRTTMWVCMGPTCACHARPRPGPFAAHKCFVWPDTHRVYGLWFRV